MNTTISKNKNAENNSEIKLIDFMSKRRHAAILSVALVLASFGSIFFQGLNLGLDFTGGIAIEMGFEKEAKLEQIRSELKGSPVFEKAQVQHYGDPKTVLVKVVGAANANTAVFGEQLATLLEPVASENAFEIKRIDFIGPVVGNELRDQSGMAMLVALFIMLFYVAARFSTKFALGAVVALFHDVIITFGFFSVTQLDFDLTVLAAVLAVIGYSLNDTIVVSDRIRENFKETRIGAPAEIVNKSLTQTLGRTIITSLTTLFVLLALFVMGGDIYVASNILMAMKISKQDFIEIKPEAVDDMP
jgi:preprotein translocase subunit SecF